MTTWLGIGSCALAAAVSLSGCGSDDATPRAAGTAGNGAAGTSAGGASSTGGSGTPAAGKAGAGSSGGGQTSSAGASGAAGGPALDDGIASQYPGDMGIAAHPDVVFADDFESYGDPDELNQNWDNFYQASGTRLATAESDVFAGQQSLEFTVPQQTEELSNAVDKILSPELDQLYLRYYAKFQGPYDVVGSSHNGSSISAHYFNGNQATPGIRADGMNKFLVNLENWRGEAETASPGYLNVYVYHPAQRDDYGDHFFPTGLVMPNTSLPFDFGPEFVERPDVIPELDRWYCYEYLVKANTPDEQDGRITFWLDGELKADFPNLRLRDIDSLKIDRLQLSFHIGTNPNGETKRWFDNVVAATSYIGPIRMP